MSITETEQRDISMKIKFWGTRGSIAVPGPDTVLYGGNTTCVEVTLASGRTVVIDAGTGIRPLGYDLARRPGPTLIHLLITHIHWDHVIGFPFFDPLYQEDTHIIVDGWGRCMEGLRSVFNSKALDGTFPVKFEDLSARFETSSVLSKGKMVLDGTVIDSQPLQHPQGGIGFRFTEGPKKFVFLTDNELLEKGWRGTSYKDFVRFSRDADLLVHDCQYLTEEMDIRRGWGHSDVEAVAKLALEAGVKRLALFHHDPRRTDPAVEALTKSCSDILAATDGNIEVTAAKEGTTVEV
ncbi:MAG: MBL fold metallo-hydrolase [Thermodesulfobacteriota bacterium]